MIIPKIACVPKYNIRHIRTFERAIRYPSRYAKLTSVALISTTLANICVYLDEPLKIEIFQNIIYPVIEIIIIFSICLSICVQLALIFILRSCT